MTNDKLNPFHEAFGPNWRISVALSGIGVLFSWLAYDAALEFHGWIAWAVFYFLSIGFGLLVARQLVFRLWITEGGFSCRTLLGRTEVFWRDIERIYFGAYDIHAHYVALGTFYRLRVVTKQGARLSIGERAHRA